MNTGQDPKDAGLDERIGAVTQQLQLLEVGHATSPWKNCTFLISLHSHLINTVSVLGREEEYMVKYTPTSEGVPEGTPKGGGAYLTAYIPSQILIWTVYYLNNH